MPVSCSVLEKNAARSVEPGGAADARITLLRIAACNAA
jgi:hypothetical protein